MKVMVTKEMMEETRVVTTLVTAMMVMTDVMTRVAMMMRHEMAPVMKEAETAAVMTDSYSTV
jgi:hypothetical protein